jgi:hypothetical protein
MKYVSSKQNKFKKINKTKIKYKFSINKKKKKIYVLFCSMYRSNERESEWEK